MSGSFRGAACGTTCPGAWAIGSESRKRPVVGEAPASRPMTVWSEAGCVAEVPAASALIVNKAIASEVSRRFVLTSIKRSTGSSRPQTAEESSPKAFGIDLAFPPRLRAQTSGIRLFRTVTMNPDKLFDYLEGRLPAGERAALEQ